MCKRSEHVTPLNQVGDCMTQDQEHFLDGGIDVGAYIAILLRKWWVVLSVFLLVVGFAFLNNVRQPDVYEARTRVLILSPVSERLLANEGTPGDRLPINPFLGSKISVDTLSALGASNDLLGEIIERLGLRGLPAGDLWSVEQLRSIIEIRFENPGGGQGSLPLITMTARSGDPNVAKRVAETWAELFIDQNSKIFATEASRSYNFVVGQFNDTDEELRLKEDEIIQMQRQSSPKILQSQLRVLTLKYEEFYDRLLEKRSKLVGVKAILASTEEALTDEPRVVTLEQSISSEALLVLLASGREDLDLNGVADLVSTTQERNVLYYSMKGNIIGARSELSALNSDIEYLETSTLNLQNQIKEISSEISERLLVQKRLNQEVTLLTENFDRLARSLQRSQITKEEQSGFVQIVESAVKPRQPVARESRRAILIAGMGGLVVGVGMAFVVHFAQEAFRRGRKDEVEHDS